VDNFGHTQALIDLGRRAGERLLAEHLDSHFRVRPGIFEVTLPPEAVSKLPELAPSAPQVSTGLPYLEAEPSSRR
jgi:hypothetical protein